MRVRDEWIEKAARAVHWFRCCTVGEWHKEPSDADRKLAHAVLMAVADDIRADLLESGELPEGWERSTEVRAIERYAVPYVDGETILYRPDGTQIDGSTWPRRTVIRGPWREGGND